MASVFLTAMAGPTVNTTAFFFLFTIATYHVPPLFLQAYQITHKLVCKHYISSREWHCKHHCKRKHCISKTSRTLGALHENHLI